MIPLDEPAIRTIAEVAGNLAFLMTVDLAELPPVGDRPVVYAVAYRNAEHRGTVWISLGTGPADDAVRNLRGLDPRAEVEPGDRQETAAELANVIAGNLLPVLFPEAGSFDLDGPRPEPPGALPVPVGVCLDLGTGVLAVTVVAS